MPQLAGAAAAWAVTAWTSAVTVVNTAMVAAAGAALPGLSFSAQLAVANFATKAVVFGGLAAASAALMRPNIPSSGTSLDFKPDPKAPVRGAMGYTALGGNKVFQATWGYKKVAMSLGVALSLGPIDQVPRFEADGATVSFTGQQNEATGFYAADMWQRTTLGLPGDAALLPPTGLKYGNPGLTGWGTQHAAPQTAFSFWTMVLAKNPEDRDVFTNGVPDPRWVGRWMKVWQPRYDSTYPGGSGPQRRDDWRTWGWSENPYDHALAWVRGHYKLNLDGSIDRTKRIAGIGAPDSAIDIPAFVEGANIADANGWTISGEWSTGDGKFQTLLAMLQAGGGEPISRGAQISVLVNAPRVATYTYTRDDLIGQAEIRPLTPRRERKNTIIPRYKSEANGWQYVPAGEVTSDVYRDEDRGEPRSLEIEYTHVRNAKQAGQLAAYDLANLREGLTATLPSKVHLMHVHPGACITVDVPELALAGQKFIVRRATTNHQAASVTLELRSESDG
ncbi:phage tail protein, partial [Brevundimonas naejangsanensis]|uniref:phage tail protein n=1 Tax=Brevundimonas naejangsanensis TaxID=588932 RepID=UPI0026F27FE9